MKQGHTELRGMPTLSPLAVRPSKGYATCIVFFPARSLSAAGQREGVLFCTIFLYHNTDDKEDFTMNDSKNTEELRQELLDEVYAGACSGLPAMLLDEDDIRRADGDELEQIARRYGLR